jgi:hypothetical protein
LEPNVEILQFLLTFFWLLVIETPKNLIIFWKFHLKFSIKKKRLLPMDLTLGSSMYIYEPLDHGMCPMVQILPQSSLRLGLLTCWSRQNGDPLGWAQTTNNNRRQNVHWGRLNVPAIGGRMCSVGLRVGLAYLPTVGGRMKSLGCKAMFSCTKWRTKSKVKGLLFHIVMDEIILISSILPNLLSLFTLKPNLKWHFYQYPYSLGTYMAMNF